MCRHCLEEPGLHSFHIISQTASHVSYHTCFKEARDKQVNRIVEHIEEFLSEKPTWMTWEWSMDCAGFHVEWYTFELTMALQKLIRKYHNTLLRFHLRNVNTIMRGFVNMCRPFLDRKINQVLEISI
jgi:hypothetical protein